MKEYKDKLDKSLQPYLSLNFLKAEFQIERTEDIEMVKTSPGNSLSELEKDEGNSHAIEFSNKLFKTSIFPKYISKTFDISKCKKLE